MIADQNAIVTSPYTWLLTRDVTGTPDDSPTDCRPAHGLAVPSDVLKRNGGNHSDPAYLSAVAAMTAAYANYPENCDWPSIHAIGPGTAPSVVMTGDESDWSLVQGIGDLAKGKYMVSVWAEGYEVAGGWFTVACGPGDTGCNPAAAQNALVYAQRNPIPTATLRIDVFEDTLPTNGQYDVGSEVGLNDFSAVAIDPGTGEALTTDAYGNPICSDYEPIRTRTGNFGPAQPVIDGDGLTIYQLYNEDGNPVFDSFTAAGQPIAGSHTGLGDGNAETPARHGWQVPVSLPDARRSRNGRHVHRSRPHRDPQPRSRPLGRDGLATEQRQLGQRSEELRPGWSQTSTLEGAHDWDTWINAGDDGLDHEMINGTEKAAVTVSGWVRKQNSLPSAAGRPGRLDPRPRHRDVLLHRRPGATATTSARTNSPCRTRSAPCASCGSPLTALHVPANVLASAAAGARAGPDGLGEVVLREEPANLLAARRLRHPERPAR